MNRLPILLFLCFLVLLLAPLRSATQDFSDRFEVFSKLHELNVDDYDDEGQDDMLEFLDLPSWHSDRTDKVLINVDGFGAAGDGVADDTQALTIDSSSAVRVKGITIQNGQQMNFVIGRSDSVRVIDVKVSAPGDSPNTDGIHITESTNVVLLNLNMVCVTGDDCVSIVNASSNIKMKNIYCGPGHGISIGSLGKDNSTGIVETVVVDKAFLQGTTNGLRIKTWQGGSGYVRAVRYQDVRMEDVSNPIIIDQFYCDSPTSCQNQTSGVEISQIMYRNITGTSKSQKAMKFSCSDTVPCTHIILNNINLQRSDGTVETYCNSAAGFGYGYINPSAECLSSTDKEAEILRQTTADRIVHTEL